MFTINASGPVGKLTSWLITLTVVQVDGRKVDTVFTKTLDSEVSEFKEDAELLVDVWKLATASTTSKPDTSLMPVIKSLRAAIREKEKV